MTTHVWRSTELRRKMHPMVIYTQAADKRRHQKAYALMPPTVPYLLPKFKESSATVHRQQHSAVWQSKTHAYYLLSVTVRRRLGNTSFACSCVYPWVLAIIHLSDTSSETGNNCSCALQQGRSNTILISQNWNSKLYTEQLVHYAYFAPCGWIRLNRDIIHLSQRFHRIFTLFKVAEPEWRPAALPLMQSENLNKNRSYPETLAP